MRRAKIAEWILRLVTSPDRASAGVGDLMETTPAARAFWRAIAGTVFLLLWSSFRADWRPLVFRAFVAKVFFGIWAVFGSPALVRLVAGLMGRALLNSSAALSVPVIVSIVALLFYIGKWLAYRAPGRELAASLTLVIVPGPMWFLIIAGKLFGGRVARTWSQALLPDWFTAAAFIIVLVAAIGVRRSRLTILNGSV